MQLADVELPTGIDPVATGTRVWQLWTTAIDEWMALSAAALVGLAARALELAVDYVKERAAFGVTVGTFQAVAHRLADCATALDGARLLAYEAAWAQIHEPRRFPELSAMSFAFASQTAREITYWSMHFHGGYGVMVEYDIQLYFRRARAWPAVLADPGTIYQWIADRRRARRRG
jgi:alkylation response protein AidB-like acyl-CoA dehydrogenase